MAAKREQAAREHGTGAAVDAAPKTARERILAVAADLFYREGIRAVGVDTIVARSGVAKPRPGAFGSSGVVASFIVPAAPGRENLDSRNRLEWEADERPEPELVRAASFRT